MVADSLQVGRIALLKFQASETRFSSAFVSSVHEVPGNINSDNFSSQTGERKRRGAISAAEVQNPQRRRDAERANERFS